MDIYLAGGRRTTNKQLLEVTEKVMDIYMAGAYNGNLSGLWRKALDALAKGGDELEYYFAGGGGTRKWVIDQWLQKGLEDGTISSRRDALGSRQIYSIP